MKKKRTQDILFLTLILVFGVGSYFIFVRKDDVPIGVTPEEHQKAVSPEAENISKTLNKLKEININRDLFEDEVFKMLIDQSNSVEVGEKGRRDPFASI